MDVIAGVIVLLTDATLLTTWLTVCKVYGACRYPVADTRNELGPLVGLDLLLADGSSFRFVTAIESIVP